MLLKDLSEEQRFCGYIADEETRSRAVANIIGIETAIEFFKACGLVPSVENASHKIKKFFEELDIADVYIGDIRLDVRLSTSATEFPVPKKHYELNVTPDLYMFVYYDKSAGETKVAGFISPEKIDKSNEDNYYYYVSKNTITSAENTAELFDSLNAKAKNILPLNVKKKILLYLDNLPVDKKDFFRDVVNSEKARELVLDCIKSESVLAGTSFDFVTKPESEPEVSPAVAVVASTVSDDEIDLGFADGLEVEEEPLDVVLEQEELFIEDAGAVEEPEVEPTLEEEFVSKDVEELSDFINDTPVTEEEDLEVLVEEASEEVPPEMPEETLEIEPEETTPEVEEPETELSREMDEVPALEIEDTVEEVAAEAFGEEELTLDISEPEEASLEESAVEEPETESLEILDVPEAEPEEEVVLVDEDVAEELELEPVEEIAEEISAIEPEEEQETEIVEEVAAIIEEEPETEPETVEEVLESEDAVLELNDEPVLALDEDIELSETPELEEIPALEPEEVEESDEEMVIETEEEESEVLETPVEDVASEEVVEEVFLEEPDIPELGLEEELDEPILEEETSLDVVEPEEEIALSEQEEPVEDELGFEPVEELSLEEDFAPVDELELEISDDISLEETEDAIEDISDELPEEVEELELGDVESLDEEDIVPVEAPAVPTVPANDNEDDDEPKTDFDKYDNIDENYVPDFAVGEFKLAGDYTAPVEPVAPKPAVEEVKPVKEEDIELELALEPEEKDSSLDIKATMEGFVNSLEPDETLGVAKVENESATNDEELEIVSEDVVVEEDKLEEVLEEQAPEVEPVVEEKSEEVEEEAPAEVVQSAEVPEQTEEDAPVENAEASEIDELYQDEVSEQELDVAIPYKKAKKSNSGAVLAAVMVIALAAVGTCGYLYKDAILEKFAGNAPVESIPNELATPVENTVPKPTKAQKKAETEAQEMLKDIEEPVQLLDSSVSVSALTVDCDVPSVMVNNYSRRYLIKLAKRMQLQLRNALLIAGEQPLANKIVVDLSVDKDVLKYDRISSSSGSKKVDEITSSTAETVLKDTQPYAGTFDKNKGIIKLIVRF